MVWLLLGRGMLAVVARLTAILVRVAEGARVSTTHMAIMIIEAGGSFSARMSAVCGGVHAVALVGRGSDENRVVGMSLDMLLEILRTLEGLAAEVALMGLQRHMDSNVGGDMIALDSGGPALVPLAGEVQVVGALAANMLLADVIVEDFSRGESLITLGPAAGEALILSSS